MNKVIIFVFCCLMISLVSSCKEKEELHGSYTDEYYEYLKKEERDPSESINYCFGDLTVSSPYQETINKDDVPYFRVENVYYDSDYKTVYQGEKLAKGVTLYPKLWGGFKVDCQEEDLIMTINIMLAVTVGAYGDKEDIEGAKIRYYCGIYNECLAVMFSLGDVIQMPTFDKVTDDLILKYPDGSQVVYCYRNKLFNAGDAYKNNLMTLEDIKEAYNNYLIADDAS